MDPPAFASPDGRYTVLTDPWEIRMSLWIQTPSVVKADTGEVLFAFRDTLWSLNSATWNDAHRVLLRLRKYPGGHDPGEVSAEIDCARRMARIDGIEAPLGELEQRLDARLSWPAASPPPEPALPGWLRRWFTRR